LELVKASRGRLKRGGICVTLGRMEAKGLVRSVAVLEGRRLYRPTPLGERAHLAAQVFHALVVAPASHRAIDETLSDWRAETRQASPGVARIFCHLRSALAVTRVLVMSLPREVGAVPFGVLSVRFGFFAPRRSLAAIPADHPCHARPFGRPATGVVLCGGLAGSRTDVSNRAMRNHGNLGGSFDWPGWT
jgi:DNA-binding PadR family transcriptional regulator